MCLAPRKILNPARYYSINSGMPMYITIPCNQCSECISSYKSEWRLRGYYESISCKYVLFDTLTYAPGFLPNVLDYVDLPHELSFSCFRKSDVQLFFKRLRISLSRLGYDVNENLRYLVVSEYGSDIRFSHRPHYHVLFFVNFDIDPVCLSRLISQSWSYGRTDGVPYKSSSYVYNHNVFRGANSLKPVLGYVSKYITKSFSYSKLSSSRLQAIKQYNVSTYELLKPLVREFHLQSRGFGLNYIRSSFTLDYLAQNCVIPSFDGLGFPKLISIPKSFQRSLFYRFKHVQNVVMWFPKPELLTFKLNQINNSIERLSHRYAQGNPLKLPECRQIAEFQLYAQNRLLDSYISPQDTIKRFILSCMEDNDYLVICNYASLDRYLFTNKRVFSASDFGSKVQGLHYLPVDFHFSSLQFGEFDYNSIFQLSDVESLMLYRDDVDTFVSDYFAKLAHAGDSNLIKMKLLERLNYIFKSKLIC